MQSLSGDESFLVSLGLVLALATLSSERVRVESLFIDEGFGSLHADTSNTVMEALDRLQSQGRRVGVISHVHDMAERIGTQIRVEPTGRGRSQGGDARMRQATLTVPRTGALGASGGPRSSPLQLLPGSSMDRAGCLRDGAGNPAGMGSRGSRLLAMDGNA